LRVVTGSELRDYVSASEAESQNKAPSLTLWTPRAALRLGMLLRDSAIAKAVRTVILDIVESAPQSRTDHTLAIRKIDLQIDIKRLELQKLELQREDITPPRVYAPLPCSPAPKDFPDEAALFKASEKAYRNLAKKYHPDNGSNPDPVMMKELNNFYNRLKSIENIRRAKERGDSRMRRRR
jgi:hypothetical protein